MSHQFIFHRLSDVDEVARTATCSVCGPSQKIKIKALKDSGKNQYQCWTKRLAWKKKWLAGTSPGALKHKERNKLKSSPHRRFVKPLCSRCNYSPEDIIEIDVHHVDENHDNNDPTNLVSLCACCHRLVHSGYSLVGGPEKPSDTMLLLNDIEKQAAEIENLQSQIRELQAGSTDRVVQDLRFKLRNAENLLRQHGI